MYYALAHLLAVEKTDLARTILSRSLLARVRTRAVRRGVWFRVLSRTERACVDLAVRVVEKVKSCLLHRVLSVILGKLAEALESPVRRAVRVVGVEQALRLSWIARRWGNRLAAGWACDERFIFFLAVTSLDD